MINEQKYENAILYFTTYCKNKYLGNTKLNKLMYYLDFVFYRDNKISVTGDVYRKLEYGPVGKNILECLKNLKHKNCIKIENYEGFNKYTALVEPNLSVFSEKEIELLQKITDTFLHYTTDKIVSQTHFEAPWLYTEILEDIDYSFASDIDII